MISVSNALRFFMMVLGETLGVQVDVMERLKKRLRLREVNSDKECDVIIAFVPIVSRAGTDIETALRMIPTSRPVVLVVLHCSFQEDWVVPDSKYSVTRKDVLAVDLVFDEDKKLHRSQRNDEALKSVTDHLISMHPSPDALVDGTSRSRSQLWWLYLLPGIIIFSIILAAGVTCLVLHYCFGKL